ncbi:hypothetical protein D1007_20680 [Hordeum vulgare]|nr:hypothetical protein D1007_20680 [Hordeum vulgare]
MSLKDANPRLEEPEALSEKTSAWSSTRLSDPRATPVLERFSLDINVKRLTGGMIVKEFLAQRLAPLQAHSRPLWDYSAGDDELRLSSQDLPTDERSRVVAILLGGDPGDIPEARGPLYRLDDRTDVIAGLPVFDERGRLPAVGSSPVEVSFGDTSGEVHSEKTDDDSPTSAPLPSKVVLLRKLADDDAAGEGRRLAESEEEEVGRQVEMGKGEREAKAARAAREEALKKANVAANRCEEVEARLQALQGEQSELAEQHRL